MVSVKRGYIEKKLLEVPVLGRGQTVQVLTGSRAKLTTYTNSTGRSIFVMVSASTSADIYINGVIVVADQGTRCGVSAIVPNGATYQATSAGSIYQWTELR